jgi:raffinose/stachyose/melibiose transport system permease protein
VTAVTSTADTGQPAPSGSPPHPGNRPLASRTARREAALVQVALWVYAAISIGPLVLVLLGSLRRTGDIIADPLGLPGPPTFNNYVDAWLQADFATYLANSLLVTSVAVGLCVTTSALAAYVLARWTFRGRALIAAYLISGLMLPVKLGAVPIYHELDSLGLVDSRLGLALVYAASSIPLAVFIITAFFRQLPRDLEDAARLDGAGEFRLFWSIMLPLVRPALATVAAITFVLNWNDFFFPLVLLRDENKYTVTVGLTSFFGTHRTDVGALFAGLVIAVLPLLLLFAAATKQIVSGLTAGIGK